MSTQSCVDFTKLYTCKYYNTCKLSSSESQICIYGPQYRCGKYRELEASPNVDQ